MTKQEAIDLVVVLSSQYKNYFEKLNKEELSNYISTFYTLFGDKEKKDVLNAVIKSFLNDSFGQPNLAVINSLLVEKVDVDCEKLWKIAWKYMRADENIAYKNWKEMIKECPETEEYITPEMLYEIGSSDVDNIPFIKQRMFKYWQSKTDDINEKALLGVKETLLLK